MHIWRKRVPWILLIVLGLSSFCIVYIAIREDRSGLLTVSFLDIGQGDAIFIDAPNGNQMLLDGGPGQIVVRKLGEAMPFYDRSIDVLMASHADQDHIGGLPDVLDRFFVARVIEGGTMSSTSAYQALEDRKKAERSQNVLVHTGDKIVLDRKRGVVLAVLFPDRDASLLETNTGSIVAKLTYGKICFLLTGDSPIAIEEYLVRLYGDTLRCDVLKVGHHGSRTSSSPGFVKAVSPAYGIISAGKDNTYGHPHQEVMDTLKSFGVKILRTDELGTITFVTDGKVLQQK